jgi:hypothetical protein
MFRLRRTITFVPAVLTGLVVLGTYVYPPLRGVVLGHVYPVLSGKLYDVLAIGVIFGVIGLIVPRQLTTRMIVIFASLWAGTYLYFIAAAIAVTHFGFGWVLLGYLVLGIGILGEGLLAAVIHHEWRYLVDMVVGLIAMYGLYALAIARRRPDSRGSSSLAR